MILIEASFIFIATSVTFIARYVRLLKYQPSLIFPKTYLNHCFISRSTMKLIYHIFFVFVLSMMAINGRAKYLLLEVDEISARSHPDPRELVQYILLDNTYNYCSVICLFANC